MIRITGGELRGRALKTPPGESVRPTQARLRQALFNSIQARVEGASVLDLFAGSGALGFEAISRGAASAVFVELDRRNAKLIEANASELGVRERARVLAGSVDAVVGRLEVLPYDIVLADPPYADGWEERLLDELPWATLLSPGGVFLLEWGTLKSKPTELPAETPLLVKAREKIYGESVLTTYRKKA